MSWVKTTITEYEWSCLISFARDPPVCKKLDTSEQFKMEIYVSSGNQTSEPFEPNTYTLWPPGQLFNWVLPLFQNLVLINTCQCINIWFVFFLFMQSFVKRNKYHIHLWKMQIWSDSLWTIYIYNHIQFDTLYYLMVIFLEFWDTFHITCQFTVLSVLFLISV